MDHNHTNSQSSMQGILLMLVNTLSLALLDAAVIILRQDFNSPFVMFVYKFSLLLVLLPWILKDGTRYLKTKRLHVHIIRSITGTLGGLFFYHGIAYISMADAAALENVQYLMIFALGSFIFNESITKSKIAALIIGFIGAIIVINPGCLQHWQSSGEIAVSQDAVSLKGYVSVIIAVTFWAANSVIIKLLGSTEHNKTQLFYVLMIASLISFPNALMKWDTIDFMGVAMPGNPSFVDVGALFASINAKHIWLFIGIGFLYFIHSSAYFLSLRSDLSVVVPFRYTKLLFSAGLGYLISGQVISLHSGAGYAAILASSLILVRYEIQKKKKWKKLAEEI